MQLLKDNLIPLVIISLLAIGLAVREAWANTTPCHKLGMQYDCSLADGASLGFFCYCIKEAK